MDEPLTDVTVTLTLEGPGGNAFVILGKVSKALKRAGYDQEFIDQYLEEAKSGDYDHLLQTTMRYVHLE